MSSIIKDILTISLEMQMFYNPLTLVLDSDHADLEKDNEISLAQFVDCVNDECIGLVNKILALDNFCKDNNVTFFTLTNDGSHFEGWDKLPRLYKTTGVEAEGLPVLSLKKADEHSFWRIIEVLTKRFQIVFIDRCELAGISIWLPIS